MPMLNRGRRCSWENIYKSGELLIAKGADVGSVAADGQTPLMYQAQFGMSRFLELLLRSKADPNTQTPEGRTALMLAADDPEKMVVS
jgi:ankyrin repeat protein